MNTLINAPFRYSSAAGLRNEMIDKGLDFRGRASLVRLGKTIARPNNRANFCQ
jgi:hypothetical protein